ncbi:uncharacterized protein LOC114180648 [Vigna unguiculata]|uniref:uncharacterized protein LOC114180648 n=1 Tax=Vigna unguiculata TaxID=3917 RepID=UPI001015D390|nr:uncharacterized protein LOC114180648 [Vigna unguiculata]
MVMSSKIAEHMQWHASRSTHEGILRHPSDSEAWKNFDLMNPQFASDPRNVRLGLATDGFNPFGDLSTCHSTWPIVLIPYNLPPWMCMKQSSFILSMIIPGKRAPGNDIDVYLRPLIEELKELWNTGVETFDSHKKKCFICMQLYYGLLVIFLVLEPYLGGTHILGHKFRLCRNRFDGSVETRNPPLRISGTNVLQQVQNFNIVFGKEPEVEEWGKRQRKDGYSSNISRCVDVKQSKLGGLKSHDSHVLMEQLLPLAMRKTLPKEVCSVLIDLCSFFKHLCNKVLKVDELNQLQNRVVLTLCHMEMLFPPAFFTVMVHLIVHLVEDAKIGGPVQYRWMYPIERYLGKLKSYVRNKAQPEGSIAEGYLAEESLTFCSRYLDGIETIFNRIRRVDDEPDTMASSVSGLFPPVGKPVGGFTYFSLSTKEKLQAHRHIKNDLNGPYSDDLKFLAMGPIDCAKRYNAYNVNGFKFRTLERDHGLKTQNSGIFDIIEINYNGRFSVTLFKCMWADTTTSRGIITDDLGFRLVNFTRLIHIGDNDDDEPYIQAAEAQMVYYVVDELDKNWSIPVHLKPRDLYDIGGDNDVTFHECEPFEQQNLETLFLDGEGNIPLTRS